MRRRSRTTSSRRVSLMNALRCAEREAASRLLTIRRARDASKPTHRFGFCPRAEPGLSARRRRQGRLWAPLSLCTLSLASRQRRGHTRVTANFRSSVVSLFPRCLRLSLTVCGVALALAACTPSVNVTTACDHSAPFADYRTFAMMLPNKPVATSSVSIDPFVMQRFVSTPTRN